MMVVKKSVPMMVALLLSGAAMAAVSSGVPTSIEHPVPMLSVPPVLQQSSTSIASSNMAVSAVKPLTTKPAPVYADTPPVATAAAQAPAAADINTNVPYASVLPKDAEIVPGAPGKNEFFIVAAEDAAKIKQLVDHTKPGREIAAADIKSKQPIVKVKLDESNSTLVSMDVVTSVNTVAKAAIKPSVQMTANDEVMTIYTKNRITPIGSRVVAVASAKTPVTRNEVDDKPMLKLMAMADAASKPVVPAAPASVKVVVNPLETAKSVKPVKGTMPDVVAAKQTIEAPQAAPLALPPASNESAPTLEMVLQQANGGGNKLKSKAAAVLASAVHAADVKAKKDVNVKLKTKMAAKEASVKSTVLTKQKAALKATAAKSADDKKVMSQGSKKKVATAGKIFSYEQLKPGAKKESWGARHASSNDSAKKLASKQTTDKKMDAKKRPLNVGVVHSYADYLTQTGHRARHSTE